MNYDDTRKLYYVGNEPLYKLIWTIDRLDIIKHNIVSTMYNHFADRNDDHIVRRDIVFEE